MSPSSRRFAFLVAAAVVAAVPALAHADAVKVGDIVSLSRQIDPSLPPGFVQRVPHTGGPFQLTNTSEPPGTAWVTFCVEATETMTPGAEYLVAGIGTTSRNTDRPLSFRTAWLYEQFRWGLLDGYSHNGTAFDYSNGQHTRALQEAIWNAQGFGGDYVADPSLDPMRAWLLDLALGRVAQDYTGSVVILTLTTVDGQAKQDQLALRSVPEPTALLLMAVGLFGLARRLRRPSPPRD